MRNKAATEARKMFPDLTPSRAAGFAVSPDGKTLMITGYDVPVCITIHHPTDVKRCLSMVRAVDGVEPDYTHRKGEYVYLAPPEPLLHRCPDCEDNPAKAGPRKVHRLTFDHSLSEQWGTCVTRHDVYRCRSCGERWVSTNGREPQVAAPGI